MDTLKQFLNPQLTTGLQAGIRDAPITPFRTTLLFGLIAIPFILLLLLWPPFPHSEIPIFTAPPPSVYDPANWHDLEVLEEPGITVKGSSVIQCYCPADGRVLGRINPVTAEGVDRAVRRAEEAQLVWARTGWGQRRRVLACLLRHILDNSETIARVACMDSGKTRIDAALGEILVTVDKLQWAMRHGEAALRPDRRKVKNLLMCYKKAEVRYEPLGVLVACVSWNYPFHNALNPIITALTTGNALLLKPSELTAHSSLYFVSLVRAALTACNAPADLITCIPCWPSVADHLTSHPGIAHVTFIGSRPVAYKVAASAAKSLTPCTLELGGKDPAIVLDDTPDSDLGRVASSIMRGTFQAGGQNCIGIERVVAQPRVCVKLLAILEPRVKALRVGSALDAVTPPSTSFYGKKAQDATASQEDEDDETDIDVGALISATRFPHLESLITSAVAAGATLHTGGQRSTHPRHPQGHYFAPSLLSNVSSLMAIAREELFAPIMLVMSPEHTKTLADVIATANATEYALGASVFGRHGSTGVERVVNGVKAGMVAVNDVASFYLCGLPFGGRTGVGSGSGYGRFGGLEGLRSVCNAKSVCVDGWWGVLKTGVPGRMDYGGKKNGSKEGGARVREAKKWAFVSGVILFGFGANVVQRVWGLWQVVANA